MFILVLIQKELFLPRFSVGTPSQSVFSCRHHLKRKKKHLISVGYQEISLDLNYTEIFKHLMFFFPPKPSYGRAEAHTFNAQI